jgi:hypothetical protein
MKNKIKRKKNTRTEIKRPVSGIASLHIDKALKLSTNLKESGVKEPNLMCQIAIF